MDSNDIDYNVKLAALIAEVNAHPTRSPYTLVTLWIGELHAPRCVADVFDGDVLTVTCLDDGAVLREIPAGEWREATVYDGDDHPLYAHIAKTPTRQAVRL